MAKAKELTVKESLQELKSIVEKSSSRIRPRIRMLIEIKKSGKAQTKYELAELLGSTTTALPPGEECMKKEVSA